MIGRLVGLTISAVVVLVVPGGCGFNLPFGADPEPAELQSQGATTTAPSAETGQEVVAQPQQLALNPVGGDLVDIHIAGPPGAFDGATATDPATLIAAGVEPVGVFYDYRTEPRSFYNQFGMPYEGGQLLGYLQAEEQLVLSLVRGTEVINLIADTGTRFTTYRDNQGTFVFTEGFVGCRVYKLNGAGPATLIGEGNLCTYAPGFAYLVTAADLQYSVIRIDLATAQGVELARIDDPSPSLEISPDGTLLAVSWYSGALPGFRLRVFDSNSTAAPFELLNIYGLTAMNDGILIRPDGDSEETTIRYVPASGQGQVIPVGNDGGQKALTIGVNPRGDRLALFQDCEEATTCKLVIFDEPSTTAVPIMDLNGFYEGWWLDDGRLMVVDGVGGVWVVATDGTPRSLGQVNVDYDVASSDGQRLGATTTLFDRDDGIFYAVNPDAGIVPVVGEFNWLIPHLGVDGSPPIVVGQKKGEEQPVVMGTLDPTSGVITEFEQTGAIRDITIGASSVYYQSYPVDDSMFETRSYQIGAGVAAQTLINQVALNTGLAKLETPIRVITRSRVGNSTPGE